MDNRITRQWSSSLDPLEQYISPSLSLWQNYFLQQRQKNSRDVECRSRGFLRARDFKQPQFLQSWMNIRIYNMQLMSFADLETQAHVLSESSIAAKKWKCWIQSSGMLCIR